MDIVCRTCVGYGLRAMLNGKREDMMRLSRRHRNGVSAFLGIGTLSMLAGCDFSATSVIAGDLRHALTITPSRFATQQVATLSQEDEAIITRAIENRHPSSADNYFMVKTISVEAAASPGRTLAFVANVDWAGFGPVTARYYTLRGLFDLSTRQVVSLGRLEPRDPPTEILNDVAGTS